jgi:hypothetical protein
MNLKSILKTALPFAAALMLSIGAVRTGRHIKESQAAETISQEREGDMSDLDLQYRMFPESLDPVEKMILGVYEQEYEEDEYFSSLYRQENQNQEISPSH